MFVIISIYLLVCSKIRSTANKILKTFIENKNNQGFTHSLLLDEFISFK